MASNRERERETERESLQHSHTSTELENPNPTFALCVQLHEYPRTKYLQILVSLNKAFLFALKAWFQYTEQQNLIFIFNILQNSQAHNNITAIITISQFIIYKYNIHV